MESDYNKRHIGVCTQQETIHRTTKSLNAPLASAKTLATLASLICRRIKARLHGDRIPGGRLDRVRRLLKGFARHNTVDIYSEKVSLSVRRPAPDANL